MSTLDPKENMRSYNRHYSINFNDEDDRFSAVDREETPGRLNQGAKRIEQHLSTTVIAERCPGNKNPKGKACIVLGGEVIPILT